MNLYMHYLVLVTSVIVEEEQEDVVDNKGKERGGMEVGWQIKLTINCNWFYFSPLDYEK